MPINGLVKDLVAPAVCLAAIVAFESGALASARGASSALIETETVQPPRAYQELCAAAPEFCVEQHTRGELDRMAAAMASRFGEGALAPELPTLTETRLRQLEQVNTTVNATIQPVVDAGGDRWTFTSVAGDCEDYVLMKRELLARLGWPRSAMRITVVHDGVGYHAILIVSTQQGDFVLDNLSSYITRVEDSPYEFVVAQSTERPGVWVRIHRAR